MRLFVGLFPPEIVRRDVEATLRTSPRGPRLKWTAWEKLHVTLVFLGEVERHRLAEVRGAIDVAAQECAPFDVEVHGLGGFPDLSEPRVLFLDVQRGAPDFERLERAVHAALPSDLRPAGGGRFHPHLTLARPRARLRADDLLDLENELANWRWRFRATEIALVESLLDAAGARYTARHVTALVGAERAS